MASHSVKNAPDLAWAVGGDDGHLTHFHLQSLCHLLLSDVEKRGISGEIAAKTGLYEYFFMFWIRPFHVLNKYFCKKKEGKMEMKMKKKNNPLQQAKGVKDNRMNDAALWNAKIVISVTIVSSKAPSPSMPPPHASTPSSNNTLVTR